MSRGAELRARNALFEHGSDLGLTWTVGEDADGASVIYLPLRDPLLMRVSLYPAADYWIVRWTTPRHEVTMAKVDRMNRPIDRVLAALSDALLSVVDAVLEEEPQSAIGLLGFLGSLAIAREDVSLRGAVVAAQKRAAAIADGQPPSAENLE